MEVGERAHAGLDLVGVLIVFVLAPAELEAGGLYFVCVMGRDVCGGKQGQR